jgi:hypothetical protein
MTCSTLTRPKMRVSSWTISIARGVRAAKSACPPSDAAGMNRPSTLCSIACRAPVRRDDGGIAAGHRDAVLKHGELVPREHGDGMRERLEVVDDAAAPQIDRLRDRRRVHQPRYVGQARDLLGDGPRDTEAGRVDVVRIHAARLQNSGSSARPRRSRA